MNTRTDARRIKRPDIEEAVPWGDTKEEAMQRINELRHGLVQMRIEKGQKIPTAIEFESPAELR